MLNKKVALLTLTGTLLSGCMVGPDYVRPPLDAPPLWKNSSASHPTTAQNQAWWEQFHDPILTELIQKSAQQNLDLKMAVAVVMTARAMGGIVKSGLFPSINGDGYAERALNNLPFTPSRPYNIFNAQIDSQWELDFFGKVQREMEASGALADAACEDLNKTMVTLQADVAKAYITFRNLQNQIKITEDNIKIQENSLELTQKQKEAGQSNNLDVLRADSQLWSTKSQLPYYQSTLARTQYQLELLLGEQPGALTELLKKQTPVPVMSAELVIEAPACVLLQRPDVREMERALAAATSMQGVAIALQYPTISLLGFLGFQTSRTNGMPVISSGLFTGPNKLWAGMASVSLPLMTFGRIQSGIDAANAAQQQAFFAYKKAVLGALSEVESALVSYFKEEERHQALLKNTHSMREAVRLAKRRYQEGLSSFLEVLDAERTLYLSESQVAQSAADVSLNLVSVYKSLGGGWKSEKMTQKQKDKQKK